MSSSAVFNSTCSLCQSVYEGLAKREAEDRKVCLRRKPNG